MDHLAELERLQHQLELANRAIALIGDRETVERLETFATEIRERLADLRASLGRGKTSRRAYAYGRTPAGRKDVTWSSGCALKARGRARAAIYGTRQRPFGTARGPTT